MEVIDSEKILEEIIGRILWRGIEMREIIVMIELGIGIGQETEILQGVMEGTGALTAGDPDQDPEQIQNRDRIRCYECREYDHFARDCPNSREERDLEHLQHMLNMEEQEHRDPPMHSSDEDSRSPLNFLPIDFKAGGPSEDSHPTVGQYLTRDQTRHVYKKVETGESINTDTIQQEVEQEKQLNKLDDDSGEENPYRELIINNAEKIEVQKTQMEQWSILSNKLNNIQHS